MTVHDAYRAFVKADEEWSADLKRVFGKRAGDVRYTNEGHTHPDCAASYERFKMAGQVWREKMTNTGRTS